MTSQPNRTTPDRRPLPPHIFLTAALVATTANLALWAVGYHHTIATGMLVGAASAGVICWQVRLAVGRVLARIEHMASDMWWHGYATCLEDTSSGGPAKTVVPFRMPRGDRSSDSNRAVNGSELT